MITMNKDTAKDKGVVLVDTFKCGVIEGSIVSEKTVEVPNPENFKDRRFATEKVSLELSLEVKDIKIDSDRAKVLATVGESVLEFDLITYKREIQ